MTLTAALKSACLTTLLLGAAACNTVQGLGEDIQSVGKKGEEVIND
ncbi:MAG: Entericidin EcnA/B family protein [Pseudomonadota bacterium]